MPTDKKPLRLAADDLARLLNILRSATSPVTTVQLVEAFKKGSVR